uniref:DM domain-containing protein n=1 Tax=Trichogramma kaykai TaxID=54128 RepID=A0ABD2X0S7_9HYME
MDQPDDMGSSSEAPAKKVKQSQRIPKCTRCQNHGQKNEVKFHKRNCPWRECKCVLCILTMKRQYIMKVQTAQRRARQQEEMESIYPQELSNVKCVLQLMEMRKKREKEKGYEETPSAMSVNGSNDSNSSDMPTLSNHISNNKPSRGSGGGGIGSASGGVGEPLVNVPMSTNLPPLLPHSALPGSPLFELETNAEQVEVLLSYSARLVQHFGYPWESLSLMYAFLTAFKADIEVVTWRINKAYNDIHKMAQFKASRFGSPYYYPGYTGSSSTLSSPMYVGQVSYVGLTSPPTPAGLSLLPYPSSHMMSAKVPSSPDSPPERPSSDPGTSYEKTTSLPPPLTTESSPITNNTLTSSPQHHAIKNLYRTLVNPLSQRDVSEYLRPADLPLAIPPISSAQFQPKVNPCANNNYHMTAQ